MAFPTIPTVASGDLLYTTTSPASTTHTLPNLSSLRGGAGPQAGDLLIAICVQYEGDTSPQFSSWGASLTEIRDDSTTGTGNGALGVAYKIASGSESGTFTVTSADSWKSVNFLMRIPASTWHGTTAPEVQAATRATTAAANPASFDPTNWAAEDTLWIAVGGHTETTTTGSPPTLDSPPTNYSGQLIVARVADAVGDITAGVAFRQLNASSEDVGTWGTSNPTRGNGIASVIAIRPRQTWTGAVTNTYTAAVVTQGKETKRAQVATTYTASITTQFNSRKGEVSWASLEVPQAAAVKYGQTTTIYTAAVTTQGSVTIFGQTIKPEDVAIVTIARVTAKSSTTFSETVTIDTVGRRGPPPGQTTLTETVDVVTTAKVTAKSNTTLTETVATTTQGTSVLKSNTTLTENVGVTISAKIDAKAQTTLTETVSVVTSGTSSSGAMDWFGQTVLALTDSVTTSGFRTSLGQTVLGLTDSVTTSGTRTGLGQTTLDLTDSVTTAGSGTGFGQTTLTETVSAVTQAIVTAKSQTTLTETVGFVTSGSRTRLGQTTLTLTAVRTTSGSRVAFGTTTLTETVSIVTSGTSSAASRRGQVSWAQFEIEAVTASAGQTSLGLTGSVTTVGRVTAYSRVSVSETVDITVVFPRGPKIAAAGLVYLWGDGPATVYGQVSLDLTAGVALHMPLLLTVAISINGVRTRLGKLASNDIHVEITTGSAAIPSVGSTSLTENVGITTSGNKTSFGQTTLTETVGIETIANTFHGAVTIGNLQVNISTTGRITPKSSTSTTLVVEIITVPHLYAYGTIILPLLVSLHTFAQGTIFITEATCTDLSVLAGECDDISLNGASDSVLALVGADE